MSRDPRSRTPTDRADTAAPIEFVAPRTDAFGPADDPGFVGLDGDDDAGFDDEPPRSRWLTGLAGFAVAGLVAGGVVAASPWSDDAATTPSSTTLPTSGTPTTVPSSVSASGTADPADDPLLPDWLQQATGWLPADDGSGFVVSSARSIGRVSRGADAFALWMTEGATRTSGRWLAIDAIASTGELRRDGTVIDVVLPDATWPAIVAVTDDGVLGLTVERAGSGLPSYTLTGSGWTLDELRTLAAGVDVGPRSIDIDERLVADGGPLAGLIEVFRGTTTSRPDSPVAGPERAITWLVSDRSGSSASVSVSALTTPAMLLTDLISRRPVDEGSLRRTDRGRLAALAAGGRVVSLFEVVRDPGVHGASWFDGRGNEVTVLTDADVHELLDLVTSLRPASDEEWTVAQLAQRIPSTEGDEPTTIGGSIDDGWSVQVAGRQMWSSAGDGWFADRWPPAEGRTAIRYANGAAAYLVLVDATRGAVDGRIATTAVVRHGDAPRDVPLAALADGTYAAAVRIDPRGPFTVEWLGADGAELGGGP